MKVGDKVRIIRSVYTSHPSIKAGGWGFIERIEDYHSGHQVFVVHVPDHPGDGVDKTWSFYKHELRT